MKKQAKKYIVAILGWQVRRLRKKNNITIVAIVGSIGKTSTKFAVAHVLKQAKTVRFQAGNYNDIVSVPLVFFGHEMPSLFNPFGWLRIFVRNEKQLRKPYPYDVVVVELGTDGPGQLAQFARYLHCNVTVVTAIAPEHMEFFGTLDAVAKEELSVKDFSDELIINRDLCAQQYLKNIKKTAVTTYGTASADIMIGQLKLRRNTSKYSLDTDGYQHQFVQDAYGIAEVYSAVAGVVVGKKLGLTNQQLRQAVSSLRPVSGRMQRLAGKKDSLILDDTYNASPDAMKAALDILYSIKAPQKIAILGNMNEMGEHAKAAHIAVGEYCEPEQLDLVVTIGPDANQYLAPAAKNRGCVVHTFDNPHAAAHFIEKNLEKKAAILAKGSQNGVFAEEAVKQLLANPADSAKLVRQGKHWLKKKRKSFSHA